MAQTTGVVQRLKITNPPWLALAYIGPTPTDTELLLVLLQSNLGAEDAAFRGAMADALSAALTSQREVIASHPDDSAEITAVEIRTA